MRVLFLAIGGTRRRAVLDESAQVVADGGTAVVLIDNPKTWRSETFADGVQVVALPNLEASHLPMKIERAVLYKAPKGAFRLVGRGPLRRFARRASGAYEHRIADRVHRRVTLPVYRSMWKDVRHTMVMRHVVGGTAFDHLVVANPPSMPYAARIFETLDRTGRKAPQLCFSVDCVTPAPNQPAPH